MVITSCWARGVLPKRSGTTRPPASSVTCETYRESLPSALGGLLQREVTGHPVLLVGLGVQACPRPFSPDGCALLPGPAVSSPSEVACGSLLRPPYPPGSETPCSHPNSHPCLVPPTSGLPGTQRDQHPIRTGQFFHFSLHPQHVTWLLTLRGLCKHVAPKPWPQRKDSAL